MKKTAIIGHFGFGFQYFDGQTVKTRMVAEELERQRGKENITCFDTHGGIKAIHKILFYCYQSLKKHDNVVALPDSNGIKVILPWLVILNKVFKRGLHYVVIGGWLAEFLKKRRVLRTILKKLDGIYVETTSMKTALEEQGFQNIIVMPNCKRLERLTESELLYPEGEPYKLCIFSRVMKEKGIEDAVTAVKAVNERLDRTVYSLDIYGPVDPEQTEWFENLKLNFPEYIRYCGLVPYDQSVGVLKHYFALLFPTRFYTEGIPGTLIDAYASGVPVITSIWMNSADIFDERFCGFGYDFEDVEGLFRILLRISERPEELLDKKISCLKYSENYTSEKVISALSERLG
ncbi:MAG: glycosyltransferase [Clostridia bacterium]|nr:glycosyltransferase [Clostridia bacterium]